MNFKEFIFSLSLPPCLDYNIENRGKTEKHQANPLITVKRNFLTDWIILLTLFFPPSYSP